MRLARMQADDLRHLTIAKAEMGDTDWLRLDSYQRRKNNLKRMERIIEKAEAEADSISKLNTVSFMSQGLVKAQCEALYEAAAKDMTQSDESRFRGLVESLDFDGVEDFNDKLSTLKENFFDVEETQVTPLVEEFASSEEEALDESIELTPSMEAYAKALSRSAAVHNATTLKD